MILPSGATVAVADGETVRLFHNTGVKHGVHLVEITANVPVPARGPRRHNGSADPDGHRRMEEDFAAITATFLNKLSLDGAIEHLVLISDPRTLGELRKHFHRELTNKIIGEFARNLTGRPVDDIAELISGA